MKGINLPKVIFGTRGLGDLYVELDDAMKQAIVKEGVICKLAYLYYQYQRCLDDTIN